MDTSYSLNTHPLSGKPMSPKDHHRSMVTLLWIILGLGVIFGIWYLASIMMAPHAVAVPVVMKSSDADLSQEMADALKNGAVAPTATEQAMVAQSLKAAPRGPTAAEEAAIAARLRAQ